VLLADDLTGAGDVGVGCLRRGWKTEVAFAGPSGWARVLANRVWGEALVLDTETRRMAPGAAAIRARNVGRELARRGIAPAYFKIDSTLRGTIVPEAEALRRSTGRRLAWLVPANPAFGRTTVKGRQYVGGRPIEKTSYARDPLHPIRSGDLKGMIDAALGGNAAVLLARRDLRRGPGHVSLMREEWIRRNARFVVPDAESDADLAAIARCLPKSDLAVGAAALARHLVPGGPGSGEAMSFAKASLAGHWLAVIGSLNPLSTEQVGRVAGRNDTCVIRLGLAGEKRTGAAGRPKWTILTVDSGAFHARFRGLKGSRARAAGDRLAGRLARRARTLFASIRPAGLILSGGLTAATVCGEIGINRFSLVGESEPGVTVSRALRRSSKLWIVTKPGGFGSPGALAQFMGPQDRGAQ
jgi:uncharacterized protein YgbK (DUF1537 family)